MSITKVTFEINDYYPLNYDYSEFSFYFCSEQTKFTEYIQGQSNNSITDKFEIKADIKYHIKAIYQNELVGMTHVLIPSSAIYKKTNLLKFNRLNLVMTEHAKRKIFNEMKSICLKEITISIDLIVKLEYFIKEYCAIRKGIKNSFNKNSNLHSKTINNEKRLNTINRKNITPYIKTFSTSAIDDSLIIPNLTYKTAEISKKNSKSNTKQKKKHDKSKSEISLVDSLLSESKIKFDKNKNEEDNNELECVKKNLLFNNNNNRTNSETTTLSVSNGSFDDMKKKLISQKNNCLFSFGKYNKILNEKINYHTQLLHLYTRYNDKLRSINKKKNRLAEEKLKIDVEQKIKVNINKSNNKFLNHLLQIKQDENDIVKLLLEFDKNNYNAVKIKKNKKDKMNYYTDKELLFEVLKNALDLNVDLKACFNDEGIMKLKTICDKYNLIEEDEDEYNLLNIKEQINEEEEDEEDETYE